jgi:hypothetical protein
MGDVIDFSNGRPRDGRGNAMESKYARAAMLDAARDKRQLFSPEDQKRAAANLHRLLERLAKQRDFTKRRVVEAAGLGGQGLVDSTKRLDAYTLPDRAGPDRIKRLAKKPAKYFKIARAIASLTNEPPESYLCQIFEGCSFGTNTAFEKDWDEHRWARLAELLRRMSTSVIRNEAVADYWTRAGQVNGQYNSLTGEIRAGVHILDGVGSSTGLAGWVAHPDDLPPVASVLLGERPMVDSWVAKFQLSGGRLIEAHFSLLLEVRLALAPVNQDGAPGPMIEFRSRLDAYSEALGEIVFDNRHSDGSGGLNAISRARVEGQWFEILKFPKLEAVAAECRQDCENDNFAWEEISPASLSSLFGDPAMPFEMVYKKRAVPYEDLPPNRFESGTAAFFLSAHLISGGLEDELAESCRACAAILKAYRIDLESRISEAEAEAERRWSHKNT